MRDDYDAPVSFARAVPIDVALHQDTLVAYAMNGEPLTPSHGAPARLVVPRWYGMASVKWLESISVVTEPFTGHFQRERYVFELGDRVEPVTTMRVKSFIVSPADGDVVDAGTTRVWGWAFTGNGVVTGVQLSIDGAEWVDAIVDPAISPYAWVRWFADVELRGDAVELRSRARDSSGAIQPDVIEWNRLGYGNNAIRRVRVTVSH